MKKFVPYIIGGIALIVGGTALIAWRKRAAIIAYSFINEKEIGNNQGFANAAFEEMMKSVGWRGGEAWCMYFDKYVYLQAFPKRSAAINKVLTGSSQQSWKNALANPDLFKVIISGSPQTGDIAIWQNINDPLTGHAAIVLKKSSPGNTVEGNSGQGGTSEGQGVTVGTRTLVPGTVQGNLKLLGFIRLKL